LNVLLSHTPTEDKIPASSHYNRGLRKVKSRTPHLLLPECRNHLIETIESIWKRYVENGRPSSSVTYEGPP